MMNCRMPIINKIEDMGAVTGRVVSGTIRDDDSLIMLPNKVLSRCPIYSFIFDCQVIVSLMTFMDRCRNM